MPADSTPTGIEGLDLVLGGGLPSHRIYLVQGDPGVGKTTLGMEFLISGAQIGEKCLYIALSETAAEIRAVVDSHGWTLDGIDVMELSAIDQTRGLDSENTLFEPSDVELQETTQRLLAEIERVQPHRLVFDSLSELRLLAQTPLRYRRQILALKQYFGGKQTTVLMLDDRTSEPTDLQLQSLAHGVLQLEKLTPLYGADRRRLRVAKLRGRKFRSGYHDFAIRTGGMDVFPRLVPSQQAAAPVREYLSSGVVEIDALLGGGIARGTSTLVLGPAGTGKSSVAIQFTLAAIARGERACLFVFDERLDTIFERTRALGDDLTAHVASGALLVQQVDPAELSAGEFAHRVQTVIQDPACRLLVIDSLNGYLHAMAEEKQLAVQLHELLAHLGNAGVATILVMAQHGLTGTMKTPVDVSYLIDTLVLLRHFEANGRIRKAISVLKKRSGAHEDTLRELMVGSAGIRVGGPLVQFTGVLTGVPSYVGEPTTLADGD